MGTPQKRPRLFGKDEVGGSNPPISSKTKPPFGRFFVLASCAAESKFIPPCGGNLPNSPKKSCFLSKTGLFLCFSTAKMHRDRQAETL
jgi:hypothetical protein